MEENKQTPAIIVIGSDHAGYSLKQKIKNFLLENGHTYTDVGCVSEASADYADYAHPVANEVLRGTAKFGILLCGSGNGINMTANKHKGIRSALCWNTEITSLARQHNDANILTLPARFISDEEAIKCVGVFLNTPFEGGRHLARIQKIDA